MSVVVVTVTFTATNCPPLTSLATSVSTVSRRSDCVTVRVKPSALVTSVFCNVTGGFVTVPGCMPRVAKPIVFRSTVLDEGGAGGGGPKLVEVVGPEVLNVFERTPPSVGVPGIGLVRPVGTTWLNGDNGVSSGLPEVPLVLTVGGAASNAPNCIGASNTSVN